MGSRCFLFGFGCDLGHRGQWGKCLVAGKVAGKWVKCLVPGGFFGVWPCFRPPCTVGEVFG